jgi:hypothetical protein
LALNFEELRVASELARRFFVATEQKLGEQARRLHK